MLIFISLYGERERSFGIHNLTKNEIFYKFDSLTKFGLLLCLTKLYRNGHIRDRKWQSSKNKKITHILCARHEFLKKCLACLIQSCYFDHRIKKPFTCSRFRTLFTWSLCTMCAKDNRLSRYFSYPQINEAVKSAHMEELIAFTPSDWCTWLHH